VRISILAPSDIDDKRGTMRRITAALIASALLFPITGCSSQAQPDITTRDVLGTAVTITAYAANTTDSSKATGRAFAAMSAVERELSPYDTSSTIAAFNRAPLSSHPLPPDALAIVARVKALGVEAQFSPALFGVTALYDFGGVGTVPSDSTLRSAIDAARTFRTAPDGTAAFGSGQTTGTPGLDFGGASKGLALDRAAIALAGRPVLLTAGSSTLAFGAKPDGEPWRVGIEDPREVGRVLEVVSSAATLSVSTSGDYQTYFEHDGVRYHHILDPLTGRPARGLRSLTVFGTMSALDADILSTALFVMGRQKAIAYAGEHHVGIFLVDDTGATYKYVPAGYSVKASAEAGPPRP